MMDAQLRVDAKCKYCKYFDFYSKAVSFLKGKRKYKNCQLLPPWCSNDKVDKIRTRGNIWSQLLQRGFFGAGADNF